MGRQSNLKKTMGSNQNTLSNSSIMVGITPQDEANKNIRVYKTGHCNGSKFMR